MKKNIDWVRHASRLFCFVCYASLAFVLVKYLFGVIFPLLLAFLLSFLISSFSKKAARKTGIPAGLWAFGTVTLLALCALFGIYFLLRTMLYEISGLLEGDIYESMLVTLRDFELAEYIGVNIEPIINNILSSLSSGIASLLSRVIKATPRALIGAFVSLMCVYYMSVDFDTVWGNIKRILPRGLREITASYRQSVLCAVFGYLRAYGILFCLTYLEVAAGLAVLCPSYALIGALAVAAVDILPVLGAGFILIPWGIYSLAAGEVLTGVGLLILYGLVSIVRRIAEPKIVGKHTGLHPLLALLCMYVGYSLFGGMGMLILPFCASVILSAVFKKTE